MVGEHKIDDTPFVPLDNGPGPALPMSTEQAEAMARAVVRRAQRGRSSRRFFAWQAAAGVILALSLGGGALAAVSTYLFERADRTRPEPVVSASKPAPKYPTTKSRSMPKTVIPKEEESSMVVSEKKPEIITERPQVATSKKVRQDETGGVLLERANRLRAQGQFVQAESLYTRIMRRNHEPEDAYVATVAAASLRLEHGRAPRAALALYRRSLRMQPKGPLAASARHGIAECYRALGQPDEEAKALLELIEAHPSHLLRSPAEKRLRELKSKGTDNNTGQILN